MKMLPTVLSLALLACSGDPQPAASSTAPAPARSASAAASAVAAAPSATTISVPSVSVSAAAAPSPSFAGIKVGDSLGSVLARAPFQKPCGDASINTGKRRLISFVAKGCEGNNFPGETTVILFVPKTEGAEKDAAPVEALAFLGGKYFESRSAFPGKMGMTVAALEAALGPGRALSSTIEDGNLGLHGRRTNEGVTLTARRHAHDVYSLTEHDAAIGFVVGAMPDDPGDERWRMIAQLYNKLTK